MNVLASVSKEIVWTLVKIFDIWVKLQFGLREYHGGNTAYVDKYIIKD